MYREYQGALDDEEESNEEDDEEEEDMDADDIDDVKNKSTVDQVIHVFTSGIL